MNEGQVCTVVVDLQPEGVRYPICGEPAVGERADFPMCVKHMDLFDPERPPVYVPAIGDMVCDCGYQHRRVVVVDIEDDYVEFNDGGSCSLSHCGLEPADHEWEHPGATREST